MAGAGAGPGAMGDEGIDPGSKFIVHQFFGEERGDQMALVAGYGKKYDYRGVLEPTEAVVQCERAGVTMPSDCYLCGLPIPSQDELQTRGGIKHELYPECEHILPVTEARWYLMLFMTTMRPSTPWEQTAVQLEYALAHRVCNQAKSNFSFIRDDGYGNPILNDAGCLTILSKIRSRALDDLAKQKNKQLPAGVKYTGKDIVTLQRIADSILKRKQAIVTQRINPILVHARKVPAADASAMVMLARTAGIVDPNSLMARVRAAYDAWNGLTPEEKAAQEKALFDSFARGIYERYPQFQNEKLVEILRGNRALTANPPEGGWNQDDYDESADQVGEILKQYFTRIPAKKTEREGRAIQGAPPVEEEYEPNGVALPQVVFFGVYLHFLERLRKRDLNTRSPATTKQALCNLYEMLMAFRIVPNVNDTLTLVFGDEPKLTAVEEQICRTLGESEQRKLRQQQREQKSAVPPIRVEEEEAEVPDIPITVDDAVEYYFTGLADTLVAKGIDRDLATYIESEARRQYVEESKKHSDARSTLEAVADTIYGFASLPAWRLSTEQAGIIDTAIRQPETEGFADEATMAKLQATAAAMDEDDTPTGPAGAGAGTSRRGGQRSTPRRPLYG